MMLNRTVCHLIRVSGSRIFRRNVQGKVIGHGQFYQSTINGRQPCKNIVHKYIGDGNPLPLRLQVLGRTLSSDTTGKEGDGESKTETCEPSSAVNPDDKVKKTTLILTIEMPPGEENVPPQLKVLVRNNDYKFTVTDKETGNPVYLNMNQEPFIFRKQAADQAKKSPASGKVKYMDKIRAKQEYCLIDKDLKGLITTKKRSPYTGTPFITLYRIADLEKKAVEVWGSMEGVKMERKRRAIFAAYWSKVDYWSQEDSSDDSTSQAHEEQKETTLFGFALKGTEKVILPAMVINGAISAVKWFQWYCSRSNSVFAEAVHSTLDTLNQIGLYYGVRKSLDSPDDEHPYGYASVRYVTSLASSFFFLIGSGINYYHGVSSLINMSSFDTDYTPWAIILLISCACLESLPLFFAHQQISATLRSNNEETSFTNIFNYVWKAHDPGVSVVMLEDSVAVIGNIIAASAVGLSSYLSAPAIDAAGSLFVGSLMAGFSYIIFKSNMNILIGRSISEIEKKKMIASLESDEVVRSVHDVKAIDLGESGGVRLKAEIDYSGEAITKELLEDLLEDRHLWMELDNISGTPGEQREFLIKFGGLVVDKLGMETDRIEENLKMKHKNIRHIDLESL